MRSKFLTGATSKRLPTTHRCLVLYCVFGKGSQLRLTSTIEQTSLKWCTGMVCFFRHRVDGAFEEGTPAIAPGGSTRITFTPRPAGSRWYHTHTFAGRDLKRGQYTGQHGFLWIEPQENLARYDAEFFLALHDWRGQLLGSGDGSMNPSYEVSTINGRVLGFGEPLRVKAGQRVLLHILNSSATDCHWVALAGHQFTVVALDGNPVPNPCAVPMLSLAPAERVDAIVELNNPGVWILGEVREHIQKAGMGIVLGVCGQDG